MSFNEALAQQPQWVQIWSFWIMAIVFAAAIVSLIQRGARRLGVAILALTALTSALSYWIFLELGFVRLIGLGHLVFWTPLVVILWRALRSPALPPTPARWLLWACLATLTVSLGFDLVDTIRYLMGERAPLA